MPDVDVDKLYAPLTSRPKRKTVRELDANDRRAYLAKAGRKYRQRQQEAKQSGSPEPTNPMIRGALADAAIALLATDGPGSVEIRNFLSRIFAGRAGVPDTVTARAKAGRLKSKLLKS